MDGSTVVAIVAAAISLAAMGVALWQGSSAHRSAAAAKKQADSSQQAADAAERSAASAEAGDAARQRVQDEAEGPTFQCTRPKTISGVRVIEVAITLINGSRLGSIIVSPVGNTDGLEKPDVSDDYYVFDEELGQMGEGDRKMASVKLDEHLDPNLVTIHLDCVEKGGRERTWRRTYPMASMQQTHRN